ncbi:zinc-ribbon domain-containing protein [Paracoccus sp. MKU1]|uniref:zinc-ribbon domain-containing protein n=1 Tax=Paracoccus sp. MKU1 TaxID=1745182 RepID=UPI0007191CEF|nr:zinc-ribbon domain-containing protein [Paracoccus sp. MKU1]KRW93382.1 hypothetical protein AQY21_24720 [Paracoccus sp. MKU1]
MRLTCPRCAAQYEIAESAIPASGREVECSACGHVWRQPGLEKSASPAGAGPRSPYDPEARPVLSRPLDESVLAILREEAARELRARETEARPPAADHIPATPVAETPPPAPDDARQPSEPAPAGDGDAAPRPAIDWPATTVTETSAPAEPVHAHAQTPSPAATDAKAASSGSPPPQPEPEAPEAVATRPGPLPGTTEESSPPDRPEPIIPALPDAEELAATLTRAAPPRPDPAPEAEESPAPAAALIRPAAPEAAPEGQPPRKAADAPPREAPVPALVPSSPRRTGYASGFGLAAMLALGVVVLYALAPQIPAEEGGSWLAEWRRQIDLGRLWLHDRILGE